MKLRALTSVGHDGLKELEVKTVLQLGGPQTPLDGSDCVPDAPTHVLTLYTAVCGGFGGEGQHGGLQSIQSGLSLAGLSGLESCGPGRPLPRAHLGMVSPLLGQRRQHLDAPEDHGLELPRLQACFQQGRRVGQDVRDAADSIFNQDRRYGL